MITELILVGGGGHCASCIDVIESTGSFHIAGIVDQREKVGNEVCGYPIIASDNDLPALVKEYSLFLITVGQIKTADPRKRLFEHLCDLGARFPMIIASTARVVRTAQVGEGSIVMHQALINSNAQVGRNCIINSQALIEHGARIGDHCHIATGAVVNGDAEIAEESFVGSGAVIREGVRIGARSVVGCHATVLKQPAREAYVTGPAQRSPKKKAESDS